MFCQFGIFAGRKLLVLDWLHLISWRLWFLYYVSVILICLCSVSKGRLHCESLLADEETIPYAGMVAGVELAQCNRILCLPRPKPFVNSAMRALS